MSTNQIVFLMTGSAHLPYLVVNLYTLRNFYQGPALIYAWPESFRIAETIANGVSGECQAVLCDPEYKGKNAQEICKMRLMMEQPITSLYLDADLIICGHLDTLFYKANGIGFCATQFSGWTMSSGIAKNRVSRLIGKPKIDQSAVMECIDNPRWPSVNSGVFAARPGSPVLPTWLEWTEAAKDVFIAGETCLHAILPYYKDDATWADGSYNCSTMRWQHVPDNEVKIFHGHGDSFVRPDKSPKGDKIWWPLFEECLSQNICGIGDWIGEIRGNGHLSKLMKERL